MYQQIENIVNKVARGTETSLFAISSARKSLSNIKANPKSLSDDVEDVLIDIGKAEEMINELEEFLGEWIKKYELEGALKVPV
jgi:hypothetical protein